SDTTPSFTTMEFTTESALVLPNAGFENWHKDGDIQLVYGSGEQMWWDNGNHGSVKAGVNVTTQDTNFKHGGNSSIKLKSQFASIMGIGKFAAGNVFAGDYVKTDGTDGVIDMGRPIDSRPSKLTGYFRYVTGEVDYSNTELLPKGATDIGSIFIAIGDWDSPVTIKTKKSERQLFDPNDPHVIAYGELNQTANTSGEGFVPFTINLDYRDTDRLPTYILIVASASKYGDYFTGSTASTMWLDDLELVYE
ncbi:MAG: PCMD domain-containing protein, partial [Bacteroidaceae bacterium]|nr:PCMD domain-containing protein [Bacteroidaceae bacterium]